MQFDTYVINKNKHQSDVCDSPGGLEEPQGKRGNEIDEKAMCFFLTWKRHYWKSNRFIVFFKSEVTLLKKQ